MYRKTFLKIIGVASVTPNLFMKKAYATSSWKLKRDECVGCEACLDEAPECLEMGEDDKASFIDHGGASGAPDYHYGCGYTDQMFAASESCPLDLIEEYG